ncbi:MAG: complex I subunit 1/NuoH family protein [Candidatus Micrarchaeia archaeon]
MEISSPAVAGYYYHIYKIIYPFFGSSTSPYIALLLSLVVFAILVSIILIGFAVVAGWLERKIMARIQARHGPTYLGKFGILQNLADVVKLLSKEDIKFDYADPIYPFVLPFIFAIFVIGIVIIPFTPSFVGMYSSLALLLVFVVLSFSPLLIFVAAWASGNKFSSISAQRSIGVMASYEIPLMLVIVSVGLLANSYNFSSIVNSQVSMWFVALMPIGFFVFFVTMLAELERPPFDVKEADNELVAGWLTDLSPKYYALALMLDYTRLLFGSMLIAILFFGGWLGPNFLPPYAWMLAKVFIIVVVIIGIRAMLNRMRIERILHLGWNVMLPLAVINLLATFIFFIR